MNADNVNPCFFGNWFFCENLSVAWFDQNKHKQNKFDWLTKTMVYSLWKISTFLDFFETSLFWSKKHSSLSRIPKNDLFWLHLSKNYTCWKVRFVDQNHGLTPLENFDFSTFLKFYFSGLKSILFYPEYQRSFLAWFAHTWCKVRFFYKNYWLTPLENHDFWTFLTLHLSGLKSIRFYSEYQKTIFTDLICPKNTHGKKLDFNTKTIDKPLWKSSIFF